MNGRVAQAATCTATTANHRLFESNRGFATRLCVATAKIEFAVSAVGLEKVAFVMGGGRIAKTPDGSEKLAGTLPH
jgi:hypothetical protein